MASDLCRILFPVDFSNRCELAARHVKTWADKLIAVLNTLHVVDPKEFGYSEERYYDVISDLVVRRTADLKYFSDHYLGDNVAHHTVVRGDARAQIESFPTQQKVDQIMFAQNSPEHWVSPPARFVDSRAPREIRSLTLDHRTCGSCKQVIHQSHSMRCAFRAGLDVGFPELQNSSKSTGARESIPR